MRFRLFTHAVIGTRLSLASFALLLALMIPRAAHATISYTISLNHPEQHLFHVEMRLPVEGREVDTAFPAWNALYRIRDFAERVRDVKGICTSLEAVPLHVRKLDKEDWQISSPGQCAPGDHNTFVIDYSIYWDDAGPFDSQLNLHHAFLNLAEILMYVPSRRTEETSVWFTDLPPTWRIATALPIGRDSYVAHGYDPLVDAPVEVGVFDDMHFQSDGATIRVVLDGKDSGMTRLLNYLQKATAYELEMMDGPPFDKMPGEDDYMFIFHVGSASEAGAGGMEHRNSTAISGGSVEEVAVVAAHEFFHVWNVKRIRPQSLEPVDYEHEQYSRALWFAEGVTNTYAAYTLERTGLWTKDQFYRDLAGQISTLQSRPARLWQSAEESSFDTWFEGMPEYGDATRSISYYNKGQILGVLLDVAIRDATDNRRSLDDVMRRMNIEYARQGRFYDDSEGVRRVVEEISGKDFKDFFARYVAGTDEIPYNTLLSAAGLQVNLDPVKNGPAYSIAEIPNANDRQRRIRDGLLHGTTN